ncbi:MAG: diguanylate cyclase, partial [Armatimonadota bacterium]|nr:diguanylate cyclase [Armatimonadota bacterium]
MRTLPPVAQLYLIGTYLAALLIAGWAVVTPLPNVTAHGWEVIIFLALAVFAYGKKIVLVRHTGDNDDSGSLSLGFAITFAALLRLGPQGALVIGMLGCLSSCLHPHRQRGFQVAFNVAGAALSSWPAGMTFLWLNGGSLALNWRGTIPAIGAACLVYYGINSAATATVIGLCTRQKITAFWRENFLWAAPSYFAGAAIGTLGALACDSGNWLMLLVVTPIAYLTYHAYAVYTDRAMERQRHIERLADLYLGTIRSLTLAIDAKDQHSHQHILRVQSTAVATARRMGLADDLVEAVNTGTLLKDIGKLGVPDYVLLKTGELTEEEFAKMRRHPEIGAAILEGVNFPWPVLPVVRSHHERWDGGGYPDGLAGETIPLTARILAVADVYDALISSRAYRSAWSQEAALAEIQRQAGAQFDPAVVAAFTAVVADLPEESREEEASWAEAAPSGGQIVKNADAVRHIQRASSELWALYEVAQTLSSSLGLQETLEILGRKLEAILPGTACLFLLRAEERNTLGVRVAVGLNQAGLQGARTSGPASRSLLSVLHQETYRGAYDPNDLCLATIPDENWKPLCAALIVPIVHQGEVLGTINLYHTEPDAFGPHDQQLLETIAERAALALYNGLLYDRTRSHANTDPLTGLYNLRYLTQHVDALCAAPDAEPLALLCMDLDSFKPINDNFGHQKGDQVLCDLAEIFCGAVRDADVVARYGGDEFLVVLRGAGAGEAQAMSQRLLDAVMNYDPGLVHETLGSLRLGVSIGHGCFPAEGRDCAALLSAADACMY